jgi:hypothetical protein
MPFLGLGDTRFSFICMRLFVNGESAPSYLSVGSRSWCEACLVQILARVGRVPLRLNQIGF